MRSFALVLFLGVLVVGLVLIGMQVTSILAVGEGHGLRGIGDLYDVLGVDPLTKWALVGVIVGATRKNSIRNTLIPINRLFWPLDGLFSLLFISII